MLREKYGHCRTQTAAQGERYSLTVCVISSPISARGNGNLGLRYVTVHATPGDCHGSQE